MVKMLGYKCFVLLYSHLGLGKEPAATILIVLMSQLS